MNYMTLGYENLLTIFIAIIGFVIVLFSQIIGDCLKTGNWILSAETPISTNSAL